MIKEIIRKGVRKILKVNRYETISSALDRYSIKIKRKILPSNKFETQDLKKKLITIGIKPGDNLMVHASWRQFYNFNGEPTDIIDMLKSLIGEKGTLFMPSYGVERTFFDVDTTTTAAGVLAEVFRRQATSVRSASTHFSICAQGPLARKVIDEHFYSEYGFDSHSAYYKFSQTDNSKILFLGLGKKPTKISLFHCAGYMLKNEIPFFDKIFNYEYDAVLIWDGTKYYKRMRTRDPQYRNNKKNFKKVYDNISNKYSVKISNLDMVLIDAKEGLEKAIEHAEKGYYCYK